MNPLRKIKELLKKTPVSDSVSAYMERRLIETKTNAERLIKTYGADFNSFLYGAQFNDYLRSEFPHDIDHWIKKHPFNFPGPFYTGESDSCGTGDVEAPDNVLYDGYTQEYIFRQPQNYVELIQVVDAAAVEVFDAYSSNGNYRWTYEACKSWWYQKTYLIEQLNHPEVRKVNGRSIEMYIDYLNSDKSELDLKRYCFFLLNNYYPAEDDTNLPALL